MATILCSTRWGSSSCSIPRMNLIRPPSTELLQFFNGYVTLRCDLDLWPFDLGVMTRDASLVFEPCTKFELDTTYRSRVWTITIFHWKIHASNWLFDQTTHANVGPWNFACSVMSWKYLYISSFMKIVQAVIVKNLENAGVCYCKWFLNLSVHRYSGIK